MRASASLIQKPGEGEKKNSRLVELRSSGTTGYEDKENSNPVENGGDSLPRRGAIARRRVQRTGTIIGQFFIIYRLPEGDKFRMLQHRNFEQSPLCHRRFQRGFGFISIMARRFRSPATQAHYTLRLIVLSPIRAQISARQRLAGEHAAACAAKLSSIQARQSPFFYMRAIASLA